MSMEWQGSRNAARLAWAIGIAIAVAGTRGESPEHRTEQPVSFGTTTDLRDPPAQGRNPGLAAAAV
jgi:hypothetical protein